jgi:hypothetical protein
MSRLGAVWDDIVMPGHEADGYVRLRLSDVVACRAYAARRIPDGLEAIILEIKKSDIPPGTTYPTTRGLALQAYALTSGSQGEVRLVLEVGHAQYRDIFRALAADIVSEIGSATSARQAVDVLVARLLHWQAFLQNQVADGLTAERLRGLFGELVVLRRFLIPINSQLALASWRGPFGGHHDFQFGPGSLEVKTTVSPSPSRFRVSNIRQLDETSATRLWVLLVLLQETASNGETLPELVASVRGSLPGPARQAFDDALVRAGYLQAHEGLYASPMFLERDHRIYEVFDTFPRLVEAAMPEGVVNVRYDVEIGACVPFRRDASEVVTMLLSDRADTE